MTTRPYPGRPYVLDSYSGPDAVRVCGCTEHGGTVFVTCAKSRWTWDFKAQKPLAFWVSRDAHYANYCYARRMGRMAQKRKIKKLIRLALVTSESAKNECISVPFREKE